MLMQIYTVHQSEMFKFYGQKVYIAAVDKLWIPVAYICEITP